MDSKRIREERRRKGHSDFREAGDIAYDYAQSSNFRESMSLADAGLHLAWIALNAAVKAALKLLGWLWSLLGWLWQAVFGRIAKRQERRKDSRGRA